MQLNGSWFTEGQTKWSSSCVAYEKLLTLMAMGTYTVLRVPSSNTPYQFSQQMKVTEGKNKTKKKTKKKSWAL